MRFQRWFPPAVVSLAVCSALSSPVRAGDPLADRVSEARQVYEELIRTPDREVPQALLDECRCIAVFPNVYKGAIGIGARYGKGMIACRNAKMVWSPLAFFTLGGGSFGLQFGAEAADVVLFFMTERGVRSLLGNKITLGAKAGVAAGPVGRSAEAGTDLQFEAEIFSYGRSKGLFGGLSLEGAWIAPDTKANREFYGDSLETQAILFDHRVPRMPEVGEEFRRVLP